jgi:hypothetical protein
MNAFRRLTVAAIALSAAPAFADQTVVHTDSLVVVTPNPPVVVTQGQADPAPHQIEAGIDGYATPPQAVAPGYAPPVAPAYAPPVPPAPYNEPWDNVNHINGRLVKVGEKGDYLLKYKKTNISTNPIGWMFGFYGVSVSHALSNHVAIRGDANIMSFENTDGYEFGVSAPIYFRRVYSGPFIEPGLIARGWKDSYDYSDCYDCNSTDSMVGPSVLFGWHWTFDSGFNVAFAFGAARDMSEDNSEYSSDEPEPAGYFRIGYAM